MALSATEAAYIALNRFGLGARPGEAAKIAGDPRGWLLQQLDERQPAVPEAMRMLPGAPELTEKTARWVELQRKQRMAKRRGTQPLSEAEARTLAEDDYKNGYRHEMAARGVQQATTDTPFLERLVMFWSNHFAVSADRALVAVIAGAYEREAIRPQVLGRFSSLLLSVEQHPAMLRYLDNVASVGPGSKLGQDPGLQRQFVKKKPGKVQIGLNENLAREILELHTLGVDGGYTQADVIELAKAITGWGVADGEAQGGEAHGTYGFIWHADAHEPGERQLLGRKYADQGMAQGEAILGDLARHPSAAHMIALKLARHFSADQPPPSLVAKLEKTFRDKDGELKAVYRTLVGADEAWQAEPRKFKRPEEFMASTLRASGLPPPRRGTDWTTPMTVLGQPPLQPKSPAGWSDFSDDWIGSNSVWKRIQMAESICERIPDSTDPAALAREALGPQLRGDTISAMAGAESPQQAMAILISSPEFQWR